MFFKVNRSSAAVVLFGLLAACSNHRTDTTAVGEVGGKPSAPARIAVEWADDAATVMVEFLRPVEHTEVRVRGIGGLRVETRRREFAGADSGDVVQLAVPVDVSNVAVARTPPGIAVSVRVAVGDQELVAVRSFSWPGASADGGLRELSDKGDGAVRSGPDGRRIRVLPAK